jgi:hypothetical protein
LTSVWFLVCDPPPFQACSQANKNASLRRSWSTFTLALRVVIGQACKIAAAFQGIRLALIPDP